MLGLKGTKEILEFLAHMGVSKEEYPSLVKQMHGELDIEAVSEIFEWINSDTLLRQHESVGYYSNDFTDILDIMPYANTKMILRNKEEFLSIYNKCLDENASKSLFAFNVAQELVTSEKQPKLMYGNPVLELAKNNQQKEELNNTLAEIAATVRHCCYGKKLQDNTLGKNLEGVLKKNNLIRQDSCVTFTKLNRPQETLEGLCYKVSIEEGDGSKIVDDIVLKVFKAGRKHGDNATKLLKYRDKYMERSSTPLHGLLNEMLITKFIEEKSDVNIDDSDCIRVYGGDLNAGYMLSRFSSDELGEIKHKIDFEKLGLKYTDEKTGNRVAGRLVDYGGFSICKNNQMWDKWVEENFSGYDIKMQYPD